MIQRFIKYQLRILVLCLFFFVFLTNKSYALGLPPLIVVQPLGLSVQNGGTAILTVAATSLSPMTFTWQFKGKPISTNNNIIVTSGTTNLLIGGILGLVPLNILTIKNVTSTNGGNYSVVIKNGGGSVTSDDATLVVLLNTVSNVLNIVSAGTGMTANGFQIQLSGPAGSNYVIQASTDLQSWTPISTNSAPSGTVSYTDTSAKTNVFRFYRARVQ
jgi:Immunoglobulin domain